VSPSAAAPRASGRSRWLLLALLCVVLVLVFAAALFPVERLDGPVRVALSQATGAEVHLGALRMELSLAGPALGGRNLTLRWPATGERLEIDEARVRPSWSLSWLRGRPAWHLDLAGEAGQVVGTLWPEPPAFAGRASELDLSLLPRAWVGDVPPLVGRLDAAISLAAEGGGILHGDLLLTARDGSLFVPDSPLVIPYTDLRARLARAPDGAATLHDLHLDGPMLTVEGSGTLGPGADSSRAALDLLLTIQRIDPALAPLLQSLGVPAQPGRATGLHISGTPSRPVVVAR
jgi:type II secretion system protein N